jgi:hypothetical protein
MVTRWAAACVLVLVTLTGVRAQDTYKHGPDSENQPGVPEGKVTQSNFKSTIFPGTVRDWCLKEK